jgi:hypothetical protein
MSTLATLAFIGAAAAAGGYLAQRDTVMDGRVMASDLMTRLANKDISGMDCDREIPITGTGAVFRCDVSGTDGSTAKIEYTMDRAGSLSGKLIDSTGPTGGSAKASSGEAREEAPLSGDPWSN